MTYGVCSDYEIDEENGIVKVKEPNNVPRIYTNLGIPGYDYDNDKDKLRNILGLNGTNPQTKIVLNGEEITFNDLFDGDKVKYRAIIVGYYDINSFIGEEDEYEISMPIVYITIRDTDNQYFGQNSGILANKKINEFMRYESNIRDAHFNPEH